MTSSSKAGVPRRARVQLGTKAPKHAASRPLPWFNSLSWSFFVNVIAISTEQSANQLDAQNDFVRVPSTRRLTARGTTQTAPGFQSRLPLLEGGHCAHWKVATAPTANANELCLALNFS